MRRHLGKLIALLAGAALCGLSIALQRPYMASGAKEWFRVVSNSLLIPGVLFLGVSGLVRISEDGLFDGIRYTLSNLVIHMRGEDKKFPTYYDYIHRERKKRPSYPLFFPGMLFLALAVVFTLLYYL